MIDALPNRLPVQADAPPDLPDPETLPPEYIEAILRSRRAWARPYHAKKAVKTIRFENPSDLQLARALEFRARAEGIRMNELLLHLLRKGWQADRSRGLLGLGEARLDDG